MKKLLGRTKKELILDWGLPDKKGSDEDGGEIIVYKTRDMMGTKYTSFYINSKNIIYRWTTNPIPPTIIYVN